MKDRKRDRGGREREGERERTTERKKGRQG